MKLSIDHIAVAASDLADGTAWLSDQLGVPLLDGGQHARYGTHNRLLGLADGLYLEVISPDPTAKIDSPRWFDLDTAPRNPRWGNWICRADDLAAKPDLTGPPVAMTRGDLHWQITVPDDGSLPMGGAFPTLIRWADDARHPAISLPDSGCRLLTWEVFHPDADQLRAMCEMDCDRVVFTASDQTGFKATFDTPHGVRVVA